jgi:hypothetical protein
MCPDFPTTAAAGAAAPFGVYVRSKQDIRGTVTAPALNAETTVVEVGAQSDDYEVEGYIDLSAMQAGDALEIREYIAVDGSSYQLFLRTVLGGPLGEPVIRFHRKLLLWFMRYKVTMVQTAGAPRSLPYGFVVMVYGQA